MSIRDRLSNVIFLNPLIEKYAEILELMKSCSGEDNTPAIKELREVMKTKMAESQKELDLLARVLKKISDPDIQLIAMMRLFEGRSWIDIGRTVNLSYYAASIRFTRYLNKLAIQDDIDLMMEWRETDGNANGGSKK